MSLAMGWAKDDFFSLDQFVVVTTCRRLLLMTVSFMGRVGETTVSLPAESSETDGLSLLVCFSLRAFSYPPQNDSLQVDALS
jgi:hypothetical protein